MFLLRALCVVAGLGVTAPPAVASSSLTPLDPTGAVDATEALQARLDATPDGGVLRLDAGATYRIDGTLLLVDRNDLRIDGAGARLVAGTEGASDRTHLRVVGGSGLVVSDLEIVGANPFAGLDDRAYQPDLVGQHGIRLEGATDVEIARVTVTDVFGDFVYVGRRDDGAWTERVWIHDSTFARSGRQGLTVTAGRDVVIERNRITDTRRATIDLEPNSPSWGAENIHILDNDVGPGRLLFVAAAGRGPVDDVVIARNRLRGHILNVWVEPPGNDRRGRFWVVDNTSDEPATRPPIRFTRVDGVVVTGNRQPMVRPGEPFVSALDSCGVEVEANDLAPGDLGLLTPPVCDASVPVDPPPPPSVAGRGAPAVATTSTTTTSPAPSPTTSTPAAPPASSASTAERALPWLVGAMAAATGVALLVVSVRRARR